MKKKVEIEKLIRYWEKSAEHDFETMNALFASEKYANSLFFGHIVLEKVLKALVVLETKKHAPRTHNLIVLAEKANLDFKKNQREYLQIVNRFNIRARYPDVKMSFYKKCDLNYTKRHKEKISKLYKKLCQKLKQRK